MPTMRSSSLSSPLILLCLCWAWIEGCDAFFLTSPILAPASSLRPVGLRPTSQRMCAEGNDAAGDEATNPFQFLNTNILFPSNYQSEYVSNDHDKVNEDGDREVINVPIGGDPVPIAQIRPKMAMVYTCKVCETRQMKQFSKLAYDKGIVIIQCKGCPKKHLIADNLGWYKDWLGEGNSNIEEMLGDRGEVTRRVKGADAAMIYSEWNEDETDPYIKSA